MRRTEAQLDEYAKNLFLGDSQRVAYKKAFPQCKRWKDETIDNNASKLAKTNEIQTRLKKLQESFAKKVKESALMSAEDVLTGIKDLILRNVGKDDKTALKGYELYGKHLKLFTDKVEHCGKIDNTVTIIIGDDEY